MTVVDVLGPVRVVGHDGVGIPVRGHRQRRLLAALVLGRGTPVSVERLSDVVWPDGDVPSGTSPLHSHVFRLRQRLPDLHVEQQPPGYVLRDVGLDLDVDRFERAISRASEQTGDDPAAALVELEGALDLWRGTPYEDLVDLDDGRMEIARLTELHHRAVEQRFDVLISLGRAPEITADLAAFVAREPLRERPRQALMAALAATGRRAEALRVYDDYRRIVGAELGIEPSPELRAAHETLLAAEPTPVASGTAGPRPDVGPRHVPRPAAAYVGRASLVQELAERLGECRLVTLVGPGGVGKTRTVLEVLDQAAERFPDGIVFGDLTPATEDQVGTVVLAAAGVEPRAGTSDDERLAEVLRAARCLVVLDNCEHVIDAAASLAETLLARTDGPVVIATSRERLAVAGEHLVPVTPLSVERHGTTSEAAALFLTRLRAIDPAATDSVDPDDVDELCARLDGLPLAIELAAARMRALSVREVIEGLDRSVSVLTGARTTVTRHRSVAAALAWSHDLLDDEARLALEACAVFAGPFGADDVAAVSGIDLDDARERLAQLVEGSFVRRTGSGHRLLYIVRRFVADQLDDARSGELRDAHARRMLELAGGLRDEFRVATGAETFERFERHMDDFRDAATAAVERRDPETAIRLVAALRDLSVSSNRPEPLTWGRAAAELGRDTGHPRAGEAFALAAMGAWKQGDLTGTRELLAAAERASSGVDPEAVELWSSLAVEELANGRMDRAVEHLDRLVDDPTTDLSQDPLRYAELHATRAICMSYAHLDGATDLADRAVETLGPQAGGAALAWAWYAAGECRLSDDPEGARTRLEQAVDHAEATGATFVTGIAGASLASLDVRAGRTEEAIARYRFLVPRWVRSGVRAPFWTAMRSVCDLLSRVGDHEAAARLLGAVTAPHSGHQIAGDDVIRLGELEGDLGDRLGWTRLSALMEDGAQLDDAAAAELATAAFDELERR